jgi:hypothetical protein
MDTKTLVVGQGVELISGVYSALGKVTKVTPDGVEVQTEPGTYGPGDKGQVFRFDNNGMPLDDWGQYEEGPWKIGGYRRNYDSSRK